MEEQAEADDGEAAEDAEALAMWARAAASLQHDGSRLPARRCQVGAAPHGESKVMLSLAPVQACKCGCLSVHPGTCDMLRTQLANRKAHKGSCSQFGIKMWPPASPPLLGGRVRPRGLLGLACRARAQRLCSPVVPGRQVGAQAVQACECGCLSMHSGASDVLGRTLSNR